MAKKRNAPSWNKIPVLAELCYEGNSKKSGIYQIVHKEKARVYIGSASRFENRWGTYLRELRKGVHHNKFLQNDFKSSGEASFRFEILEIVEGDNKARKEKEQTYLDQLFSSPIKDLIYNISKLAVVTEPPKPKERTYRKDWYWFLSPEGIEYVVENLSEFCKIEKLYRPSMNQLSNDKLEVYKGWKKLVGSTNNTVVNEVTKEEVVVFSVSEFSRKAGIQQSHLSKLIAGKRKSCGDWVMKNRVIVPRPHKGKVYWLMSPEGIKTKVNNLARFAEENNLDIGRLHSVINGEEMQHKGWLRFGITQEDVKISWEARYAKMAKTYEMLNPDGESVMIHNMTKFCRENGLTKQCMLRVVKGTGSIHKGWKISNNKED